MHLKKQNKNVHSKAKPTKPILPSISKYIGFQPIDAIAHFTANENKSDKNVIQIKQSSPK